MATPEDSPRTPAARSTGPIEPSPLAGPLVRGGYPVWAGHFDLARTGGRRRDGGPEAGALAGATAPPAPSVELRFVGRPRNDRDGAAGGDAETDRGSPASLWEQRRDVLAAVEGRDPQELPLAGLRQVHSDRVLPAHEGLSGEGDALVTSTPGLALSLVIADCVPVILAGPVGPLDRGRARAGGAGPPRTTAWTVAAVHAGWRGIVAGVVPRTLDALAERGVPPTAVAAWIGPSIGACCYEVSDDVAVRVASVSGPECVVPRPAGGPHSGGSDGSGLPHLDLVAAVRHQLTVAGVPSPRVVLRCTRCDAETLWSYRREGKAAGRNHAFVWLEPATARPDETLPGAPACG